MIGYTGEITDLFDAYAGNTADLITHGCTRTDIFFVISKVSVKLS